MSTFDGRVVEFPDIRIDHFRPHPNSRPPLAYFVSHVHTDHLVGLESFTHLFIYCTPATRDILLRLEKYPHRMNFARGILETRIQTYRHLNKKLKAIPLETPTKIELAPGNEIQVTLFDANHCIGACMFLIEGDGKAVLYTGDIRSEAWWINSLTRHPTLLQYACSTGEPMKTLDCIYLDTTFVVAGQEDHLRDFDTKAQGITELLRKVDQYPSGTQFYLDSWTFGYEDVWQALSKFLGSQVHLDDFRFGMYRALENGIAPKAFEARQLIGFPFVQFAKTFQKGCLTNEQTRLHSCERGTECEIWSKDFVRITPIVTRYRGEEIAEMGAGGGQSDLNQRHELQLWTSEEVGKLRAFCTTKLEDEPQILSAVIQLLESVISNEIETLELKDFVGTAEAGISQSLENGFMDLDEMPLEKLVPALAKLVTREKLKENPANGSDRRSSIKRAMRADGLAKQITFPYSRHSSFNELCLLLDAFKPKDIFPCTLDDKNWNPECSMKMLFGHIYKSTPTFRHDQFMLNKLGLKMDVTVADSRPGSSGSTSTVYATPLEDHPKSRRGSRATDRDTKHSLGGRDGSNSDARKRRRISREAQGDLWPPRQVDHYSTPHDQSQRQSIQSETGRRSERPISLTSSFDDSAVDKTAPSDPISYRGQLLLARSTLQENGENKEAPKRRMIGYGRLSPQHDPPTKNEKVKVLVQHETPTKSQPPQNHPYGRLSPPPTKAAAVEYDDAPTRLREPRSPSSRSLRGSAAKPTSKLSPRAEEKLAFRQEAYNAVLGIDGQQWDDIGLVSVSGHQVKEEEL